jgi:L-arabinose isomerase
MNADLKKLELWFVTGSQHLYGPETLKQVDEDSKQIAQGLSRSKQVPVKVVFKPVVTTPEAIYDICMKANTAANCIGMIAWMHTFSPAKMWIAGLSALNKPFVHLHTQINRPIPWADIDMDFKNLNQSAHGDREFGFICARMRRSRKIIVGHWQEERVQEELGVWARAACAWHDAQGGKVARFGDNMRQVAVTEGDKVAAQMRLGYSVDGFGVGDLVARVNSVTDRQVDGLVSEYESTYKIVKGGQASKQREALREAARIELGMRTFLEEGGFKAFTTTFEDLHGLKQLPGLAVQRLMADG